jgi:hypothetical protein
METETVERTKMDGPRVGDILVSTWGYDQTNVDFWWVFSLTPSAKSVRIRPLAQRVVDYSQGSERVVPVDPAEDRRTTDEATTSLIRWFDHRSWVNGRTVVEETWCVGVPVGHRNTAHRWDGRPVHQTAFGWGH